MKFPFAGILTALVSGAAPILLHVFLSGKEIRRPQLIIPASAFGENESSGSGTSVSKGRTRRRIPHALFECPVIR